MIIIIIIGDNPMWLYIHISSDFVSLMRLGTELQQSLGATWWTCGYCLAPSTLWTCTFGLHPHLFSPVTENVTLLRCLSKSLIFINNNNVLIPYKQTLTLEINNQWF